MYAMSDEKRKGHTKGKVIQQKIKTPPLPKLASIHASNIHLVQHTNHSPHITVN